MLSVRGIYEDGKVRLLEAVPAIGRAPVIVTILDERTEDKPGELSAFEDLVGAIAVREDGAEKHDEYLYGKRGL